MGIACLVFCLSRQLYFNASRGLSSFCSALGPLWSLQIEEQFYIVFPSIVWFLRKRLWIALLATVLGALGWRISMWVLHPENPMIQYAGTLSRLDGLALGGLGALLVRRAEGKHLKSATRWLAPLSLVA